MDRQVRHLVRLMNDLLDISRVTLGKLELRKQKVSVDVLLSSAIEASKPLIDAGKHTLATFAPDEPITLDVDPIRIAQVITNLLNNAAKYTPNGGAISLTARHKNDSIQIEVKDNGVGLTPQMRSKVLKCFLRSGLRWNDLRAGLGLGCP